MHWLYLLLAILSEVVATSALKACDEFRNLGPSVVMIAAYLLAFVFLSLTLRTLPIGVAYAVWSGVGIALISTFAWFAYGQRLDAAAIVGIAMIMGGVVVIKLFSHATA